ncbi:MAG: ArnT family glycosyltransferase, partial [Candidatus Brocadiales bacterium]
MLPLMSGSEKRHLFFLVLFALSIRLYVFLVTPVIGTDGYNWFHAARCFAEGDFEAGLRHPIHPVYPLLFAGLTKLIGDYESAGKAVALIFGTLSILPLYFLVRSIFSHKVGIFASFLLAINPTHVRLSADIMSDPTYIFFFLTAIWLGWEIVNKRRALLVPLLALSISLAYLTRAEGVGLAVCIVPWLIWAWFTLKEKRLELRRTLTVALFVGLVMTPSLLYVYSVYKELGVLQISRHGAALELTGHKKPSLPEITMRVDEDTGRLREPVSSRLARWKQGREYHKIVLFVCHKFIRDYFEPLFAFFLVGFFKLARPDKIGLRALMGIIKPRFASQVRNGELYLLTPLLLYFPIACFFAYQTYLLSGRYILSIVVLGFVWGGVGIERVSQYFAQFKSYFQRDTLGFERSQLLLLLILLAVVLPKDLKIKRKGEVGKKEAGHWIKAHSPTKNPTIMGLGRVDLEKVAFYAQGEFRCLSSRDYNMFQSFVNETELNYLVFYKEELMAHGPGLFNRVEEADDFTLLKEWVDKNNGKEKHLRVYEFV